MIYLFLIYISVEQTNSNMSELISLNLIILFCSRLPLQLSSPLLCSRSPQNDKFRVIYSRGKKRASWGRLDDKRLVNSVYEGFLSAFRWVFICHEGKGIKKICAIYGPIV